MTILSAEEKKTIVEQHLKNILFAEYNLTLSILESNAMTNKNDTNLSVLNDQMSEVQSQKTALQSELDSINAEIAASQNN